MNPKNNLYHDDKSVGMITKQCLHKCLENGDITPRDVKVFYSSVFEFFTEAVRLVCVRGTYETEDIKYYRMDMVWGFFLNLRELMFHQGLNTYPMVAKSTLCIPHGKNAVINF